MTADKRLTFIRGKIERAKKHINDLKVESDAFLSSNPYEIGSKRDPQTGELIHYVSSKRDVPLNIPLIAGDALHNLRSSLDHLACHLVEVAGNKPTRQTSFPIAASPADYLKREMRIKVHGMRPDAIKAIDALEPYKGGQDMFWQLHKLDNIDKHRLLVATGAAYLSHSLTPEVRAMIGRMWNVAPEDLTFDHVAFMCAPNLKFPLEIGDELFRGTDCEANQQMRFRFGVAFAEPEIIHRKPIFETLGEMADALDYIIWDLFMPLLV